MIHKNQLDTVRENWIRASEVLGFKINSPYQIQTDILNLEVFALISNNDLTKTTVVDLIAPPPPIMRLIIK